MLKNPHKELRKVYRSGSRHREAAIYRGSSEAGRCKDAAKPRRKLAR